MYQPGFAIYIALDALPIFSTQRTTVKEETQIDEAPPIPSSGTAVPTTRKAKSYATLRRNLSEKELMNIGSVNLMIDDIERMEVELSELRELRPQFHDKDKQHAILVEKLAAYKLSELSYNISISLGALLVGSAKALWAVDYFGVVALTGGLALWLAGTAMKFGRMFVK
jgi:hypothetical protein